MKRFEVNFPNEWKGIVFETENCVHVFVQDPLGRDKGSYCFDGKNFKHEFFAFLLEPLIRTSEYNSCVLGNDLTFDDKDFVYEY